MAVKKLKQSDLFDEIGRGVILPNCKLCGAIAHDRARHVIWHNALSKMLARDDA